MVSFALDVHGKPWTLQMVEHTTVEGSLPNDMGACDRVERPIQIRDDLPIEHKLETVIHEVLHACIPLRTEEQRDLDAKAIAQAVRLILNHTNSRGLNCHEYRARDDA